MLLHKPLLVFVQPHLEGRTIASGIELSYSNLSTNLFGYSTFSRGVTSKPSVGLERKRHCTKQNVYQLQPLRGARINLNHRWNGQAVQSSDLRKSV